MSQLLNNKDVNIFYTDTDSYFMTLNKPFEYFKDIISDNILGKFKLEYIIKKAVFLATKLYCFETIEADYFSKTRGLSHTSGLTFKEFESLFYKDSSIIKNQEKWFKNIYKGNIRIEQLPYEIKYTENKRHLVFDNNGKLVSANAHYQLLLTKKRW